MSFNRISNDLAYYTLTLRKGTNTDIDEYRPLSFQDNRNDTIIDRPSDYEMSIVKFSLDTPSLPVFIPEIEPNQPNPYRTIYSVTLSYLTGGVETYSVPVRVIWVRRDFTDTDPAPPNTNQNGLQSITRAYYSYSYQDFIECINTAFLSAMLSLVGIFPALATIDPPRLVWDTTESKATLYTRQGYYDEGLANQVRVYINKALYPYFSSFPVDKFPISANLTDYRIRNTNYGVNISNNFFGAQPAIATVQEYETTQLWSPFTAIGFTTNLLPIATEYLSPPLVYQNGQYVQINRAGSSYANIITDLTSQDFSYRSNLLYVPQAEYRMISLFGQNPISSVDITVVGLSKLGFLVPIYLHSNCSVSIKFLFRRKQV